MLLLPGSEEHHAAERQEPWSEEQQAAERQGAEAAWLRPRATPLVKTTGFVEHIKLPHYVDFQSELELVRQMRREAAALAEAAAE